MTEMIDVLNADGTKTGRAAPKEQIFRKGLWHRGATLCVINDRGEFLLHKRSPHKRWVPNVWANGTAGRVDAGESATDAIIRESFEELGLTIPESDLIHIGNFRVEEENPPHGWSRVIFDVFLIRGDYRLNRMRLNVFEVSEARYVAIDKLEEFMDRNPTITTLRDHIWPMVKKYLETNEGLNKCIQ
ncbi:MAG: NUDIX domain-containing protein [Alphaproteobacteria bacterium]|nr:NUDIX domain-containing protein [Alphaproteobacteria bacterium]